MYAEGHAFCFCFFQTLMRELKWEATEAVEKQILTSLVHGKLSR